MNYTTKKGVMKMIISIINQKGGVGKTTTAVSLASRFAKMEYKTLLVDLDPQANATISLGINSPHEPFQRIKISDYLDLMPSSKKLSFFDMPDNHVKNLLKDENDKFILIDCPPVLNNLSVNAITAADFLIIPILSGDHFSLVGLKDIFGTIESINQFCGYKILLTNVNERLSITKHFINMLIQAVGEEKIFKSIIRIDSKLKEAPFAGLPIDLYDVNSKGSIDYGDLALEIINIKKELICE